MLEEKKRKNSNQIQQCRYSYRQKMAGIQRQL